MSAIASPSMIQFAGEMRRRSVHGTWDGRAEVTPYFLSCRAVHEGGALVLFTRDVGHHASGWWRNPGYERCLHLSLSFWEPARAQPRPFEPAEAEVWVRLFFGPHVNLIWQESAVTSDGREKGVRHYRVFCDEGWRPMKPRGEVYSRHLTERGWKSWSEVQAERAMSAGASERSRRR